MLRPIPLPVMFDPMKEEEFPLTFEECVKALGAPHLPVKDYGIETYSGPVAVWAFEVGKQQGVIECYVRDKSLHPMTIVSVSKGEPSAFLTGVGLPSERPRTR